MQAHTLSTAWVKISARIPKKVLKGFTQLSKNENLSMALRSLMEREIMRAKTLKAHKKLYGRFKPEDFDESLL